jgi:hypothetical protein
MSIPRFIPNPEQGPSDDYFQEHYMLNPALDMGEYLTANGVSILPAVEHPADLWLNGQEVQLYTQHPTDYDLGASRYSNGRKWYGNESISSSDTEEKRRRDEVKRTLDNLHLGPSLNSDRLTAISHIFGIDVSNLAIGGEFAIRPKTDNAMYRTVFEDPAIPGRLHILNGGTFSPDKEKTFDAWEALNYMIYNMGDHRFEGIYVDDLPKQHRSIEMDRVNIPNVARAYAQIRNLGRFGKGHLPIVQFVDVWSKPDEPPMVLNVSRGRRTQENVRFDLTKMKIPSGMHEAFNVIGATHDEGYVGEVILYSYGAGQTRMEMEVLDGINLGDLFATELAIHRKLELPVVYDSECAKRLGLLGYSKRRKGFLTHAPLVAGMTEGFDALKEQSYMKEVAPGVKVRVVNAHIVADGNSAWVRPLAPDKNRDRSF